MPHPTFRQGGGAAGYDQNRLPTRVDFGDPAVVNELYTETSYDDRLRPERSLAVRTQTSPTDTVNRPPRSARFLSRPVSDWVS